MHTLFLRADGTVAASGLNNFGQLGNGSFLSEQLPITVSGLSNIVQVSAGNQFSAALGSNGNVWAWGRNQIGEIGNGTTNTTGCLCVLNPTQSSISGVIKISVGDRHTLALKSDGTVWGWGQNSHSQLGDNTNINKTSPVQVGVGISGFNDIIAIGASLENSIALKSDGTVWVWGSNDSGQSETERLAVLILMSRSWFRLSTISSKYLPEKSFSRYCEATERFLSGAKMILGRLETARLAATRAFLF